MAGVDFPLKGRKILQRDLASTLSVATATGITKTNHVLKTTNKAIFNQSHNLYPHFPGTVYSHTLSYFLPILDVLNQV